jgi:predicted phage tail protein
LDLSVVSGDQLVEEPAELLLENFGENEVYVSLIPTGAGKGWGKLLAAAVLVALIVWNPLLAPTATVTGAGTVVTQAALFSPGMVAAMGSMAAGLALQGISELMAKPPKHDKEADGPGLFDGPENTLSSGQPVPVLYGELLVGGSPIHVDYKKNAAPKWSYPVPTDPRSNNFTVTEVYEEDNSSGVTGLSMIDLGIDR